MDQHGATKKPSGESGPRNTRYLPAFDRRLTLQPQAFELASFGDADDERFELHFLEEVLSRDPCNEDALMILGHAYTRRGEYQKGLAVDQRLVRLRPADPTAYYNLACSHSLLRQVDDAFAALERAAALGYRDVAQLSEDPDLGNVRKDARFRRLVSRLTGKTVGDS